MNLKNLEAFFKKKTPTSSAGSVPSPIVEKVRKINGDQYIKHYREVKRLGKGGFAVCLMVEDPAQKEYAIKVISKQLIARYKIKDKMLSQLKIHRKMHHPGIVEVDHIFEDQKNVYIVLELCRNGSMAELVRDRIDLCEVEARFFLQRLAESIKYIHSFRILHRDIKLGNIFLSEGLVPKLGDFGLSIQMEFQGEKKRTICGTPNYIAPEIISGDGYSYEVDIWSLGVMLYIMLSGKPPFQGPDVNATYKNIVQLCYKRDIKASPPAFNLIQKCLTSDPAKRLTIDQFLSHPFFTAWNYQIPKQLYLSSLSAKVKYKLIPKETEPQPVKDRVSRFNLAHLQKADVRVMGFNSPDGRVRSLSPPAASNNNAVFVFHMKDWSEKYGMFYLLSNGIYGMYFLDHTILQLDQKKEELTEINRQNKSQSINTYSLDSFPEDPDHCKKLKILRSSYKSQQQEKGKNKPQRKMDGKRRNVYLKQYIKLKEAILFRLSNNVMQTIYAGSKEQLILDSKSGRVRYWSEGGKYECGMADQLDEDSQMFDCYTFTNWVVKQHRNC